MRVRKPKPNAPQQRIIDKLRQGWQLSFWHDNPSDMAYTLNIGGVVPIDIAMKDFEWLYHNGIISQVKRTPKRTIYELTEVPSDAV